MKTIILIASSIVFLLILGCWLIFYMKGKQFALKNRLHKADAIVVLAGTRGNIKFLDSKIQTAVHLYREEWAPYIICSGRFSAKVADSGEPNLIPLDDLQAAARNGRIQEKDIARAAETWDVNLGANYLRNKALAMGVPANSILEEDQSLHTRENAEYVLDLLKEHHFTHIILVTSPFHQLRTYLTFKKVFDLHDIMITNFSDTNGWHPATWFLSSKNRHIVHGEIKRIKLYRAKGDL
jgi:uncharacterized SAM-binding protein YcdF (DUF218 family)